MKINLLDLQKISMNKFSEIERNYEKEFFISSFFCNYEDIYLVIKKWILWLWNISYSIEWKEDCNIKDEYKLFVYKDPEVNTTKHIVIARNDHSDPEGESSDYIDIKFIKINENEI